MCLESGLPKLLFDGEALRVVGSETDRSKLVVTLDRWRRDRNSFPEYQPSKTGLENGYGHISIRSSRNDWFLNSETEQLRSFLAQFCRDKESCAIGFSMGGYGALLFANALRLRRVLLFSPQYSIMPDKAPFEAGYLKEASTLDPTLDHLEAMDGGVRLQGVIAYDPRLTPQDRMHADRIRALHPDLRPVALPFGGHTAVQHFAGTNITNQIMRAFIEGDLCAGAIRGVHGLVGRSSSDYQTHLKAYLAKRQQR
ncbi:hypothetical protein SAMN04488030_1656 [Aliiroseovarius halocynthiae]|nr:hypothetical protein SAMN04488030_1656 [Aliiroseovarius halocynthiae]